MIRIADLTRDVLVADWWPLQPADHEGRPSTAGELSISVKIKEELILPNEEYATLLEASPLLNSTPRFGPFSH